MKLVGIVMIASALSAGGFFAGEKYFSVLKGIDRADKLLGNIILGLQSERMTIEEIFENAVKTGDETTKNFIENLSPQETGNAAKIAYECGFCKNDTANSILSEAFFVLGRYSAEEQVKEIEFCRRKLKNLYEKSEEPFLMKAKLARYSGVLAGIFAAIVLF